MCDMPENLQVIKTELPSPTEKSTNLIKERLNLHVKRRLQQDATPALTIIEGTTTMAPAAASEAFIEFTKKRKIANPKQSHKTRKCYQKRADKLKTDTKITGSTPVATTITIAVNTPIENKKISTSSPAELDSYEDNHDQETDATDINNKVVTAREKEKCPDVLSMMLSVKKCALMQNAEVQQFMAKLMKVIKN